MNFELVNKYIQPDTVIDIGANGGGFYLEALKQWPLAYYLLIEANEECRHALSQLREAYMIAVLSDTVKEVTFYTRKDSPCCTGASYYRENTPFYEGDKAVPKQVLTRTLDGVMRDRMVEGRVLLKIDCQGSELDILRGGEKFLENCAALILEVSYSEYNQGAPNASEVDAYVASKGFKKMGSIYEIVHPISRDHIQDDMFYLRE
jgi:FkbM family methyltransferase